MNRSEILSKLGLTDEQNGFALGNQWSGGEPFTVHSPIDGKPIATVNAATANDVASAASANAEAFLAWRVVPAPRRGELVRRIGQAVRDQKEELAALVTLEVGKIRSVRSRNGSTSVTSPSGCRGSSTA